MAFLSGLFLLVLSLGQITLASDEPPAEKWKSGMMALAKSRQLVLVVSSDWNTVPAQLRCFERSDPAKPWQPVFAPSDAVVGRNGMAWGVGLHGTSPSGAVHVKREGDGRAPAGIFALVAAFGYAPVVDARITAFPYLQLTATIEGVDDAGSRYYNRVVDAAKLTDKDWNSSEKMLRDDGLYRWGVTVGHNPKPMPGFGSCIFLHIWRGENQGTSGCTAMPAEYIETLVRWLDQSRHPVLVQLPSAEYIRLKQQWMLP
jgi:D-alanyl-D-alanine dipeptidase